MDSRTRGYLPHLEISQAMYFLTFRLEDSLPSVLLQKWKTELISNQLHAKNDLKKKYLFVQEYEKKVQSYASKQPS
jgi:hypothetical protein